MSADIRAECDQLRRDPRDINGWLKEWEHLLVRIDASQLSTNEYLDLLADIRALVEGAIEAARRGEP